MAAKKQAEEEKSLTEKQLKELVDLLRDDNADVEEVAKEHFDHEMTGDDHVNLCDLMFECFECEAWKLQSECAYGEENDPVCRDCVAARGTPEEQAEGTGLKLTRIEAYRVEGEDGRSLGQITHVRDDDDDNSDLPLWSKIHPSLLHILGHDISNTQGALEEITHDPGEIYLLVRVTPKRPKAITKDALGFISNEVAKTTQKSLPKTYKLDRIDVNAYYPGVCSGANLSPGPDRRAKAAWESSVKAVAKRREKAATKAKNAKRK